jgi:hypothetical protein
MKVYVIFMLAFALDFYATKFARETDSLIRIASLIILCAYVLAIVFASEIFWGN